MDVSGFAKAVYTEITVRNKYGVVIDTRIETEGKAVLSGGNPPGGATSKYVVSGFEERDFRFDVNGLSGTSTLDNSPVISVGERDSTIREPRSVTIQISYEIIRHADGSFAPHGNSIRIDNIMF